MNWKILPLALLIASPAQAADKSPQATYVTPAEAAADPDFSLQGEYAGKITTPDSEITVGVQVIALGGGNFRAVAYEGGLPGAGWDGNDPKTNEASLKDGKVLFLEPENNLVGVLSNGKIQVLDGTVEIATLPKVVRASPTIGKKAPEGAIVLFDGSSTEAWKNGKLTADALLMQGVTSNQLFSDPFHLHIEFRLPYKPNARGQGRGNSGIYMQGRYETQMLDSFGLSGEHNECGGVYSIKKPDVNMCLPPLSWQTYDIDFSPAIFAADGKKTSTAKISVKHNGVTIHSGLELPKSTTAAPLKESPAPGPIYIQDHGNPVRFRNIWLVEKPATS